MAFVDENHRSTPSPARMQKRVRELEAEIEKRKA